jgi:N6-L-threonylcarbamoyladenine synthase
MGAPSGLILGIETSCDETAVAVVDESGGIRSNVIASQVHLHAPFGGVVPELASRGHLEALGPSVAKALAEAGVSRPNREISAVAVTSGPGLMGALATGVAFAKALALSYGCPVIGINHLEGHLFALFAGEPGVDQPDLIRRIAMPVIALLVSGGHTMLVRMDGPGSYRVLGQTLDDAAGEAFDKVARYLGLGFPGGPALERAAAAGDPKAYPLPVPALGYQYDFSFSGIKTAAVRLADSHPEASSSDIAASFQAAVTESLATKTLRAAREEGARGILIAGGVAANGPLRELIRRGATDLAIPAYVPSVKMCTDNGAMIAAAGWWRLGRVGPSGWDLGVEAGATLESL